MTKHEHLSELLQSKLNALIMGTVFDCDEVTLICERENLKTILKKLRTLRAFYFEQLIDVCAVDYLTYGHANWETETASFHGFSRGVDAKLNTLKMTQPRFAVVYHLLSIQNNQRVRVKTYLDEQSLFLPTVCDLFPSANWYEREVYDLFGILFEDHPDLRRILTDYGFIGYPLRKDFPVSGHVEMRYDAKLQKVIYEPVDIEPRTLAPKVIRHDNRYLPETGEKP